MSFSQLSETEKFALKVTLWVFLSASAGLGSLLGFNLKASWENQSTQGQLIKSVESAELTAVRIEGILRAQVEGANDMREVLFKHQSDISLLKDGYKEHTEQIEKVSTKIMRIEAKLN